MWCEEMYTSHFRHDIRIAFDRTRSSREISDGRNECDFYGMFSHSGTRCEHVGSRNRNRNDFSHSDIL